MLIYWRVNHIKPPKKSSISIRSPILKNGSLMSMAILATSTSHPGPATWKAMYPGQLKDLKVTKLAVGSWHRLCQRLLERMQIFLWGITLRICMSIYYPPMDDCIIIFKEIYIYMYIYIYIYPPIKYIYMRSMDIIYIYIHAYGSKMKDACRFVSSIPTYVYILYTCMRVLVYVYIYIL